MGRAALGFKARTGRAILVCACRAREHGRSRWSSAPRSRCCRRASLRRTTRPRACAPPQARAHVRPASHGLAAWPRTPCARRPSAACTPATRCAVARCWSAAGCRPGAPTRFWRCTRACQAEGELFREVLIDGAHACGLALTTLPDKNSTRRSGAAPAHPAGPARRPARCAGQVRRTALGPASEGGRGRRAGGAAVVVRAARARRAPPRMPPMPAGPSPWYTVPSMPSPKTLP